ncbi:MAG: MBL fold metallo-hydrolase [Cyanobacteria bacterium P01_A01_bin.135]
MLGSDALTNPTKAEAGQRAEAAAQDFTVTFWGVRGGIPTPGMSTLRYGGNTACVELNVGGERLIFDAGTGLTALGKQLQYTDGVNAHIFFTHTHWDRIQGFPFFIPAFRPSNCFNIYGAVGLNGASIKQRLMDQMILPNFPVSLRTMESKLHFHNIDAGTAIKIQEVTVETLPLNRLNGALGYRITWQGLSVVYATDTAHLLEHEAALAHLAYDADVLIIDAVYIDHAYFDPQQSAASRRFEQWHTCVGGALSAGAKKIIIFHHDPSHEDDFLDRVEAEMGKTYTNVQIAREGMNITLL